MAIKKLRTNFVERNIPKNGPFSTEDYSAAMEELSVDLVNVATRWNEELYPLIYALPRGSAETRWVGATNVPDPESDGLHGDVMLTDNDATSTSDDGYFWNGTNNRPRTIKETAINLHNRIADLQEELEAEIADLANGLTGDQWARLGLYVQDGTSANAVGSVAYNADDALTKVTNMAADIYNGGTADIGSPSNTIQDMVDALLELHNGDWSGDIALNHTGITLSAQSDLPNSASYAQIDRTPGTATDTQEDLNRIRYEIARTRVGAAAADGNTSQWYTDASSPVGGDIGDLNTHLNNVGTGSATATNPHAYARADIDDLDTEFGYNNAFTGKTALGSELPTYSSNNLVSDSDSLETAVGKLDAGCARRRQWDFTGHTNINNAIRITHNEGIAFPLIQVYNTDVGGDYGVMIDENYVYEQARGIVTTDEFVSIEIVNSNIFDVFTSAVNGKIIAVF